MHFWFPCRCGSRKRVKKAFALCKPYLAITKTSLVITMFSQIQNTAPYQPLWRKLTLPQPKPVVRPQTTHLMRLLTGLTVVHALWIRFMGEILTRYSQEINKENFTGNSRKSNNFDKKFVAVFSQHKPLIKVLVSPIQFSKLKAHSILSYSEF